MNSGNLFPSGTGVRGGQLVARGVLNSLAELDAVMCELDGLRPGPTVTHAGWARGMDFNRGRVGSGGARVLPPLCLCCAWERAAQPGPRMAPLRINGDVMLEPCERHASRPDTQNPQAAPGQGHFAPFPPPVA